jgi:hypothetical protein
MSPTQLGPTIRILMLNPKRPETSREAYQAA